MLQTTVEWNCASYSRLSREDKDGTESNSIKNQKELIREYIKSTPEICLSLEIEDDGFSGVDFLRPGFQKLLEEIKANKINCVVVKDLSRFGRNYIEVGDYIDKIFPFMGVRFIAINDGYDSLHGKSSTDEILIPFKNLVNDTYLRDTSIKIRSQFEIKRKKGEFVGAFAPYGYKKDPEQKGKLIIDEYAAVIVTQVFKWKIEGYSNNCIAGMLNERGESAPYDYRKQKGENFRTPFKVNPHSDWTAGAIGRLLANPVYIGMLVQGKITTPNHKVKKTILKPEEEWVVVSDTHEPIIDENMFDIVQNILKSDTRLGTGKDKVYLFSGVAFCSDCGSAMCRKTVLSKGKKYYYLTCAGHKAYKNCSTHSFSENKLSEVVLEAIKVHISCVLDLEQVCEKLSNSHLKKLEIKTLDKKIENQIEEIGKIQKYKLNLYEDMKNDILSQSEYEKFNAIYSKKLEDLENSLISLHEEIERKKSNTDQSTIWIEHFKKYKTVNEISRNLIVSLIKEIIIYEDKKIEIEFLFQDKFNELQKLTETANQKVISFRNVVE